MPAVAVSALGEASVKHRTYIRVDAYFEIDLPLPTNAKVRPSFGQDDEHRRISEAHWEKQRLDAKEKDEAQVKA